MTANTAPPPGVNTEVSRPRVGFGHILLTVPHLALLGVLGTIAATVCFSLLTAGLASLFAFGVGLAVLVGLVYVLFGIGWFELERVRSLYGFEVAPLRLRERTRPGFGGWVRAISRQSIDGRMWLAILSFSIGSFFGLIVLRLMATVAWNLAIMVGGEATGALLGPWRFFGPDLEAFGLFGIFDDLTSPLW